MIVILFFEVCALYECERRYVCVMCHVVIIVCDIPHPYHSYYTGSDQGPNYSREHIASAASGLAAAKIAVSIMVDCSHGNRYV